ncbi:MULTISPECIES: hypothetical protein [Pseudomonas]|uniref:hypothetical protein n=1 Tax=Pseudomonas TaxID=286 RepID=UPI0005FB13C1|nr:MULTISPECIES: hypothetical protein [Pseudomonas]KJZ33236.1 hypothetical protein VC33_28410 [Pseudomonas fluorescens]OOG11871.1 hypothetical protein BMS17_07150 [Pseudomonas sp. C9]
MRHYFAITFRFEGSNMYSPALVARLCLALLCLSPLNFANAVTTPGDTDLIRERQDRLLEEQRRRLEELKELPGKEAKPVQPSPAIR